MLERVDRMRMNSVPLSGIYSTQLMFYASAPAIRKNRRISHRNAKQDERKSILMNHCVFKL